MAKDTILHNFSDWSEIDASEEFWADVDFSKPESCFGIHQYKEKLWTSGFVGVGRLYSKHAALQSQGREHVVIVSSKYELNPWRMLEKVLTDDEYDYYEEELSKDGKFLFRVMYNQPFIQLAQEEFSDNSLLYALSFIHTCYVLCKKGLKKTMLHNEEIFKSKVKGKINIYKNIRMNTCRGHNDRFYCKYIDFSEDNIENRILKATLKKCKELLEERLNLSPENSTRIRFCMHTFHRVKSVTIKQSDFNSVSVSGLYMYYRPVLQQAKSILAQKYYSFTNENGCIISKSVFTIPYMINMETLFEFYARTTLKDILNRDKYELDAYSKKWFLVSGMSSSGEFEKGIHLIQYCIPDIIIRDRNTDTVLIVMDAKYKAHNRAMREDSLQLLSYVLRTGAMKCGFIFPGEMSQTKMMVTTGLEYLRLETPLPIELKYYELIISDTIDDDVLKQIL